MPACCRCTRRLRASFRKTLLGRNGYVVTVKQPAWRPGMARQRPGSVQALEELGRVRLSPNFFLRDFLYSEIANFYGIQNIPDDLELAIEAGRKLCTELLE